MAEATTKPTTKSKKKQHQTIPIEQLHIQATFNNTLVS